MIFRKTWISKPLALLTGIIFLNVSFLLTEIDVFGLKDKDRQLFETIVYLLNGSGFEEEKDPTAETSVEVETDSNDFLQAYTRFPLAGVLQQNNLSILYMTNDLISNYSQIFSPPPEFTF